ncbi:hypothetical protein [Borrelia sp. RT1S]|uniref:hypothetical protein n=1 Tax=Borrelia sp. RT1S TaxID=2898580 RepID=UPI001E4CEF94|nr:hypothetical protein [Borrelia sp. RT1S]UGQ17704.1 hypothetical protein LSO05_04575 [Borrelia sp. RT1S]UGQ17794.1 hypothetical protein LSO05_05030 [Borrelia sp. RT1S]
MSFSKHLPVKAEDLNKIRNDFDRHFAKFNLCKVYGRVIEGFSLVYDTSDKKVTLSSGIGFTPSGSLINLKDAVSVKVASVYEGTEYVHLVFVRKTNNEQALEAHLISYEFSGGVFDPYSYLKTHEEQYRDYLAVGFIKDNSVSEFNRPHQEPIGAVGSLFLFEKTGFKDYITLRGCRMVDDFNARYLKFSIVSEGRGGVRSAVRSGGRSRFTLETRHIPTLSIEGVTNTTGSHTHQFTYYSKYRNQDPEYRSDYLYDQIRYDNPRTTQETSYEGSHTHLVYPLEYNNSYQRALELTPKCRNLAPIERVY